MKKSMLSNIMMLLISLIMSCELYAQNDDEYTRRRHEPYETPGDALIGFSKGFYTGFAFQVVGAGMYVISQTAMDDADESSIQTVAYVGGSIALLGTIIELVSFGSIGKAGRLLNEQQMSNDKVTLNIEPTQYGVGIVCRF